AWSVRWQTAPASTGQGVGPVISVGHAVSSGGESSHVNWFEPAYGGDGSLDWLRGPDGPQETEPAMPIQGAELLGFSGLTWFDRVNQPYLVEEDMAEPAPVDQTGLETHLIDMPAYQPMDFDASDQNQRGDFIETANRDQPGEFAGLAASQEEYADDPGFWLNRLDEYLSGVDAEGDVFAEGDGLVQGPVAGRRGGSGRSRVADAGGGVSADLAESLGVLAEGVAGAYQQRDTDGGVLDAAVAALDGALAGIQNGPYHGHDRGAALNLRAALAYYVHEGHVNAPDRMPPISVGDREVALGHWLSNLRLHGVVTDREWVIPVLDALGMRWGRRRHVPGGEGAAPSAGQVVVSGGGGGEVVPGLGDGGLGEGLTAVVPESAGGLGADAGAGSLGEYVSAVSDVPMELSDVDGGFFDASMVLGGALEFPQGGDDLGEWLEGLDSDLRLPMQGAGSPTAGQSQPVEGEPTWSAPIDQTGLEAPLNDASAQQSAIFDPLVHSWEQGADHPGSWLDLLGAHLGDGGAEDSEVVGADWFHDLGNAQGDVPPEGDGLVQGSVAGRQGGVSADLAES
ncbi:hypothetical protein ACFW8E_28575, partial [Bacillus cereus]